MAATSAVTHPAYLDALARRVLVFDGAMGTGLQSVELNGEDWGGKELEGWIDGLVLHSPEVVAGIHRSYLEVGCDVLETCTFQSTRPRLAEWNNADRTHELNARATELARAVCDEFATAEHPRLVAGSIGPTGFLPSSDDPSLGNITFGELVEAFREQARGLVEGGCDLIIIETAQDILEVKAAVFGCRAAFEDVSRSVPIQAQVSILESGTMLLGTDIAATLAILEGLRVDAVGLNCAVGPELMRDPIRYLCSHTRLPVTCIPNAGIPLNVEGRAVYPMQPQPFADELARFVDEGGVRAVGGCCGTTPDHLRELVSRVARSRPREREVEDAPMIASSIRAVALQQVPAPLLIGERVNAQGSRKMKRLLLADDYDGILDIAREQTAAGAHALDVQVALTERTDEAEQMRTLVKKLQMSVELPIVFDTTEVDVVKAALETYPGRPIVNSINLEEGRTRIDAYLPLVRDHGAAVIALTIWDEIGGMAKTRDTKLAAATRIFQIATGEYGLAPHQLIFDTLTFTLATGQEEFLDSAVETIEGIRAVKRELPGALTTLGLSNVSFGLAPGARPVLNSVFLKHCVDAGLDTVIINPAHVVPYADIDAREREIAEDLIFNRDPEALARFIAHFEESGGATAVAERADPFEGLEPAARIHQQILQRRKEGVEEQIDLVLRERDPVSVLNEVLLPAMKDVGDRFGAGELILPFVLQSAEVMKRAVAHLEQFLERKEGVSKGTVVLATVYGDVHDIGKNLVNTILSNNGYTVHDLGKQVPVNRIIERAVEERADAIGLSALLVSTSKQMPACVRELDSRGHDVPVIIGGAAINRGFGRRILYVEGERTYEPGVFFCKDAFEGLETVDQLVDEERRPALLERIREQAAAHRELDARKRESQASAAAKSTAVAPRSSTSTDAPVPTPPFWGANILRDIAVEKIYPHIDRNSLFKMSWQFKGIRDPERWSELLRTELEPRLELSMREAERDGYLRIQAAYGYWPALADGDDVIVYDPADRDRVVGRFSFPRQSAQHRLCMADYVRPLSEARNGERDVVALQVVSTGSRASEISNELQVKGDYDAMLRVHGFATQMAEATAEWLHSEVIRGELGLGPDQGRRYSWGFPACPDLSDHELVFRLLPTEDIGVALTEAYQLVPEHSTAAIVLHHPEARYFAVYTALSGDDPVPGAPEPAIAAEKRG